MATDHVHSTGTSRPARAPAASGAAQGSAVHADAAASEDRVFTLRLPLVSATFTRQAHPDRQVPTSGPLAASHPPGGAAPAVAGVPLSRLAFYAGAVALGALEVVEWPVTLLVVAGTYLADHVRSPAAPGPVASGPAAAAADSTAGATFAEGVATGGPAPAAVLGPDGA